MREKIDLDTVPMRLAFDALNAAVSGRGEQTLHDAAVELLCLYAMHRQFPINPSGDPETVANMIARVRLQNSERELCNAQP